MDDSLPTLPMLYKADIAYARYNALKTFADRRESQFTEQQVGGLTVTFDIARDDGYYNRIVGLDETTAEHLTEGLGLFPNGVKTVRVDVLADAVAIVQGKLEAHGFTKTSEVHWLWQPLKRGANHHVHWCQPEEVDKLRPLLEYGRRPIDDDLWAARSQYWMTELFDTFTIQYGHHYLAMGTTFFTDECAILGNAFTLPDYRRRDFHTRLLTARLNRAYERRRPKRLACAFVDVTPDSQSERNCLKKGFRPFVMMETWEGSSNRKG